MQPTGFFKLLKLSTITLILVLLVQTIVTANDLSPDSSPITELAANSEAPIHIEGLAGVRAGNTLVNNLMKDIAAEIETLDKSLKEIDSNNLTVEENLSSAETSTETIITEAEAAAASASPAELNKYATTKEVDVSETYYVGKVPYQKDIYDHGFELYLGEVNTKDAEAVPL